MHAKDEILLRLFTRHFADPVAALRRLDLHLCTLNFGFDLKAQLRELEYPPQPKRFQPITPDSFIYYFVPNCGRGTYQKVRGDALHESFVNTADGIAINLGCPVRLLRALDVLTLLPASDQAAPRDQLCHTRGHLAAIEELLWLTGWNSQKNLRRGGQFPGMRGDVDWAFEADAHSVFLESKFRASDWPRISDRGSFLKVGEGFLSKALHKFPDPPQARAIHVVGVTLFDNISKEIISIVADELKAAPQIHVVVFRSLIAMTHVVSLTHRPCKRVRNLLTIPAFKDLPENYQVIFHREDREKRVESRPAFTPVESVPGCYCLGLPPTGLPQWSRKVIYRGQIVSHGDDGEPAFTIIPPWLPEQP